jgi:hypothetical protein
MPLICSSLLITPLTSGISCTCTPIRVPY